MAAASPDATRKLLASIWERNLPTLRDRLSQLDSAAAAAAQDTLDPPTREAAGATAHKLAGSLGMFGYTDATNIARELEVLLDSPGVPNPEQLQDLTTRLRNSLPLPTEN